MIPYIQNLIDNIEEIEAFPNYTNDIIIKDGVFYYDLRRNYQSRDNNGKDVIMVTLTGDIYANDIENLEKYNSRLIKALKEINFKIDINPHEIEKKYCRNKIIGTVYFSELTNEFIF